MNVDTQQHLGMLREALAYRIRELESEIHAAEIERARAATEADAAGVIDFKDEAEAERREAVAAGTRDRGREELAQCRAALQRLDEGVYGDCLDCGEPIALARLLVQPQAARCAACQSRLEHYGQAAA